MNRSLLALAIPALARSFGRLRRRTRWPARLAGSLLPALLVACDRDAIYAERSFSDAVYDAYAECSKAEIRFLASKHNIQTAFENCGSNNFLDFSWSPDGIHLYFRLPMTAHIMNGEQKTIITIPTEQPIAETIWLSDDLLAMALGPAEGDEEGANRLVLYNRAQNTLTEMPLPVSEPGDLQAAGTDAVVMTGLDGEDRVPYRASFTDRSVNRAFPWLTGSVDTFTYSHEQDLVAWGVGETVTIASGADGAVQHTFIDATRASIHPEGRYIALETLGAPISPFDQRTWDELSPEAREREIRRKQEWMERQPDWVPKEVRPPTIDLYVTELDQRFRVTGFYGDRFEWYPYPYYGSFVLWGIEGKELNKNVAISNLAERLHMLGKGEMPLGIEAWMPPGADSDDGGSPSEPIPASDEG